MQREAVEVPDAIAPSRRRWELLTQGVLLLAALAAFFPGVFFRGELASGADLLYKSLPWRDYRPPDFTKPGNAVMPDIITAMVPYYALTKSAFANSEWPLWNPLELTGMPLLANCQSAVFYPPRLLHEFLDLHVATSCYYLLKLWLCGMTAFLCARGLGLGLFGARFFSIAWAFNGFNLVWCYWPLPDVCAWLPVLFYAVEMAARGHMRPAIYGIAAGGALSLLAGHPETAFTQALAVGIYFVLRLALAATPPRAVVRAVAACALGWALALGVTASQWLPFIEYLANSYTLHARSGDDFGNYVNAIGVMTLFVPRFLGTNADGNFWGDNTFNLHSYYPGLITWAGLLIAVTLLRKRASRPMTGALFVTMLLCALWAFGVPGVSDIFGLPGLKALRLNYNIVFAVFAACLLAAQGLEHWLETRGDRAERISLAVGAAAVVFVLYLGYEFIAPVARLSKQIDHVHHTLLLAAGFAVLSAVVLVATTRLPQQRLASGLILAMLFADLFVNLRGMNPTVPRSEIYPRTALTDHLKELPQPARVQAGSGFVASGLMAPYGTEDWLGYDGLYPDRIMQFDLAMGPKVWDAAEPICSIAWYLYNPEVVKLAAQEGEAARAKTFPVEDTSYFEYSGAYDGLEIYRNKKALPRAYVSGAVKVLPSRDAIFDALKNKDFVPGAVVYTEVPPTGPLPDSPGLAGTAEVIEHTACHVRIHVHADRAGALVLSDAFFPGWRAELNGKEAPIFPAYHIFRGVMVPAGDSDLSFTYFPRSFQLGLAISAITLVLSLLAELTVMRRFGA